MGWPLSSAEAQKGILSDDGVIRWTICVQAKVYMNIQSTLKLRLPRTAATKTKNQHESDDFYPRHVTGYPPARTGKHTSDISQFLF